MKAQKLSMYALTILVLTFCIFLNFTACNKSGTSLNNQNQNQDQTPNASTFSLTSEAGTDGGMLPAEYTCDGAGSSPPMSWTNVPSGTKEFALMMTTLPVDGTTKWDWVLYGIPSSTLSLAKSSIGVGTLGVTTKGTNAYVPPCSQGPGLKTYTFTIYALSSSPTFPAGTTQVTGEVLTKAIASITIGSCKISLNHTR